MLLYWEGVNGVWSDGMQNSSFTLSLCSGMQKMSHGFLLFLRDHTYVQCIRAVFTNSLHMIIALGIVFPTARRFEVEQCKFSGGFYNDGVIASFKFALSH